MPRRNYNIFVRYNEADVPQLVDFSQLRGRACALARQFRDTSSQLPIYIHVEEGDPPRTIYAIQRLTPRRTPLSVWSSVPAHTFGTAETTEHSVATPIVLRVGDTLRVLSGEHVIESTVNVQGNDVTADAIIDQRERRNERRRNARLSAIRHVEAVALSAQEAEEMGL